MFKKRPKLTITHEEIEIPNSTDIEVCEKIEKIEQQEIALQQPNTFFKKECIKNGVYRETDLDFEYRVLVRKIHQFIQSGLTINIKGVINKINKSWEEEASQRIRWNEIKLHRDTIESIYKFCQVAQENSIDYINLDDNL